ncbi:CAP domain-containing protein [Muricauda oceani]|uniref:CAP domain-containing protein n=1 Tax=Flagellimonas oceani TaxID=2698672 RepID=A0A6G7J0J7_9FLAO|nr:CAP domain-containing protein [Allomuricauda oceani]MBW8244189.1 CAP domain-containing protein [Allomuricauda oceani]QII44159.1 CAP domain-containing protein [Allomuricauda oceani]
MKQFSRFFIVFFLLVSTYSCTTTSVEEVETTYYKNQVSSMEEEILELVNQHRASIGMNTLEFDGIAYDYAIAHTKDMINKQAISHDDFDQRSSNLTVEAKANYVSEIVGRNFVTAKGVVDAWLKSDSHRRAIEGDYIFSAVSAQADANGVFYFTQMFYR